MKFHKIIFISYNKKETFKFNFTANAVIGGITLTPPPHPAVATAALALKLDKRFSVPLIEACDLIY
jgi:hypothetical protein